MFQPDNHRKKNKNLFLSVQSHSDFYQEMKNTNFGGLLFSDNENNNIEDNKANRKKDIETAEEAGREHTKKQKPNSIREISYHPINLLFILSTEQSTTECFTLTKNKTKEYFSHVQPFLLFYCDVRKKTMQLQTEDDEK